ncbi:ankyrin [Lichtheimia hyalospora FSU 10163]|nr:ankyrin [Lichtheimia hyalospora FSU 10163]
MTNQEGASNNEQMLAACRIDQIDTLVQILDDGNFDPNYTDSVGNTAAHYAAKGGSIECLEALVNLDDIDLDIKDHMEGNTPLHKAVEYQSKDVPVAECMVDLLLQGGADPSIENRNKSTPLLMVDSRNTKLKELLEQGLVAYQMADSDIADEDDYGDDIDSDDQASN